MFIDSLNESYLSIRFKIIIIYQAGGGGGDPELGLRDLAALRSKTFAIPSYPF